MNLQANMNQLLTIGAGFKKADKIAGSTPKAPQVSQPKETTFTQSQVDYMMQANERVAERVKSAYEQQMKYKDRINKLRNKVMKLGGKA